MAKSELRGASRREFIKGAVAIGAALGWGPSKLLEFLDRGGLAHADASHPVQRLVMFVGNSGAHGYQQLMWPQPDSYVDSNQASAALTTQLQGDRFNSNLAAHFLQSAGSGGQASSLGGSITNVNDYSVAPPAYTDAGGVKWAAGQRFRIVTGVDNMAFRGYTSPNGTNTDTTTSRGIDAKIFNLTGTAPIPSNFKADGTRIDPANNFIIAARETPWLSKYGLKKAITSIDGGPINPFHIEGSHNHYVNFAKGWTVMGAAATIQQVIPSITPVLIVGNLVSEQGGDYYGTLPGAPTAANVSSAAGMVDLFNSNAVRAGGALSNPANAVLFEAYTKGFIGTSKTATLPTFSGGYRTGKLSANLVGLNLADKLKPTDTDRLRYGVLGNVPKAAELRDRMIVAAKALQLGLTSQVVISYFDDDPHALFTAGGNGGINAATAAAIFGNLLNAFMDDLMSVPDPFFSNVRLGDNTVIAFTGDVPRTGLNTNAWQDPTTGAQNRAWIMSNGLLRTGFFGGDRLGANNGIASNDAGSPGPGEGGLWDMTTGDLIPFVNGIGFNNTNVLRAYGDAAMASVLYAITRGDIRRVNDFYSGKPFPAVQVPVLV